MKDIYNKNDLPKTQQGETHSYDVITCDEFGLLNIAFYDFKKQEWCFHTETMIDYNEKDNKTEFVWMYAPIELITYLKEKK